MNRAYTRLATIAILTALSFSTRADSLPEFSLTLDNHLFFPSRLEVPAYKKFKLVILNKDSGPEEFDSFDLNREKVIFPQRSSVIFIGPLEPGRYDFFGEYNSNTARGAIIATPIKTDSTTREDHDAN